MSQNSSFELFGNLLAAKTGNDVGAILRALGDFPKEVALGEPFGAGFAWQPIGGRTTNVSTVELATHPGRAIVERINNSIDALIDERLASAKFVEKPATPADAARLCFGRPAQPEKLVAWFDESDAQAEAARLSVVLLDGLSREEPRLDVFDGGPGIPAAKFCNTILSLNVENKIKVPYALGLFGQGGSASFAFASFTLIISRSTEEPGRVAFTIVRRCEIEGWKESCYAFLTTRDASGCWQIPSVEAVKDSPVQIYGKTSDVAVDAKLPAFRSGTLVRHFDYKLPQMGNALSSSQKNLYHSLHYLLFDPLLPYRVTDLREGSVDTRHVAGSRNRLMKLVEKSKESGNGSRTELKHYHRLEYIAPPGSNDPCIGVEWWVVFSWRKEQDGRLELRSGTEQFADRDHPIIFTYHGQDHGELTADCLRKLGLNLLRRHMVIHLDVSRADGNTKRELFTATRENLKRSSVLDGLTERLTQLLSEDARLYALEKELTDRALSAASSTETAALKERVIELLQEHGLEVGTVPGTRRRRRRLPRPSVGGPRESLPPIPTLPFPKVTRFDVVRPVNGTVARRGESKNVWIETDASDEFDRQGLIQIRCEPPLLEITSKTPLRGGRMKYGLMPVAAAVPSETGALIVSLRVPTTTGSAEKFHHRIEFEIGPERTYEENEIVYVPEIEIVGLAPSDCSTHETWRTVWPDIEPSQASAARTVAYKVYQNGRTIVYFNSEFPPYANCVAKWKSRTADAAKMFADEYKLYLAFHAVLQSVVERPQIELEQLDKITEQERALTAMLIVKHSDTLVAMHHKAGVSR
ncbi:MAG TPA: hypothetical protein VGP72_00560 [Planctomycetota bacterium]|jgi:hypothetical protein